MKADSVLLTCYTRVVVDTNVLLSAALSPSGAPAKLLDQLLLLGRLVFSAQTFAELDGRIWKPEFDRYLSIEQRRRILHEMNAAAFWVEVPADISRQKFSRDPNDDAFVHAAIVAEASRLISGDDDLLCLHPLNHLHILSSRSALNELDLATGGLDERS
jgi:putative PIN family toxin of toxin-antitoxin system